jgi:hypothetical protein
MPSTGSDLDLSATVGAANSSLDLYKAPYEKRASSTNLSVFDGVTNELNNLSVSDVRPRRDTFPVSPLVFTAGVDSHIYFISPLVNLLGPRQPRDFNTKPSLGMDTMTKVQGLHSLQFRTINLCMIAPSQPHNHPLFSTNNQGGLDTAFRIPRTPQLSCRHQVSLP